MVACSAERVFGQVVARLHSRKVESGWLVRGISNELLGKVNEVALLARISAITV